MVHRLCCEHVHVVHFVFNVVSLRFIYPHIIHVYNTCFIFVSAHILTVRAVWLSLWGLLGRYIVPVATVRSAQCAVARIKGKRRLSRAQKVMRAARRLGTRELEYGVVGRALLD